MSKIEWGSEDRISLDRIIRAKVFFANLISWSKVLRPIELLDRKRKKEKFDQLTKD
jgi:hypothetical protein